MCAVKKSPLLNMPIKLILTNNGVSYFLSHGKKLARIKLANNHEQYGVKLMNFTPQSIQRMILLDYIAHIEVSAAAFSAFTSEFVDLAKVLVYSLLYKQFDSQVFSEIIETECVKKHNRSYPTELLDRQTAIDEGTLRTYLANKQEIIAMARKKILEPLWDRILSDAELSPDEKNVHTFLSEKFLNRLSLLNWYIIIKFFNTEGFAEILPVLQNTLDVYMEKSRTSDYIAMLLAELSFSCENANITTLAREKIADRAHIASAVTDSTVRAKLIQELAARQQFIYVMWTIGGGTGSIGKQGRLQIALYTHDGSVDSSKIDAARLNGKTAGLADYCRELALTQKNTDLCFYYLTCLDEMCKKRNIKLESMVTRSTVNDVTILNLIVNF